MSRCVCMSVCVRVCLYLPVHSFSQLTVSVCTFSSAEMLRTAMYGVPVYPHMQVRVHVLLAPLLT